MLTFLDRQQAMAKHLDWPDVYFSPQYGAAVEQSDGGKWEVALWEPGPIIYPYIVRPIEPLRASRQLSDIASPYGYAGTWAPAELPATEWRKFRSAFRRVAAERGVVSEFQRITPLLEGARGLEGSDRHLEILDHSVTAAIDIDRGFEAWWTSADGRVRTAVRKAERAGYEFTSSAAERSDLEPASPFRKLYDETMRRVGARPYYLFSERYYETLTEGLGKRLRLARVSRAGALVSAALFIAWDGRMHYHLAGSDPDAARDGTNALLISRMIAEAVGMGLSLVHLGGGVRPADTLWNFKRGFATRVMQFRVATSVLLPDEYASLTKRGAATASGRLDAPDQHDYFPAYRAPATLV